MNNQTVEPQSTQVKRSTSMSISGIAARCCLIDLLQIRRSKRVLNAWIRAGLSLYPPSTRSFLRFFRLLAFTMKSALVILAAVASASAHSTWQQLWVGSTDQGTKCTRTVKDNSPIESLSSADMFCGRGPAKSDGVCEVAGR
jgi:hypothetical protein